MQTFTDTGTVMPALFIGHGNPMNAIEENPFSRSWGEIGRALPPPRAILCVSAHWETVGSQVTAMERPEMIYDFSGFPRPLYEVRYPAPGSPELALLIGETVRGAQLTLDMGWGLDHGAWSVLCRMFPQADIPVVQLSLDRRKEPAAHYALACELRDLRRRGVLIVGSGNIVHNLGVMVWRNEAFDWAKAFDEKIVGLILEGHHDAIVHYPDLGPDARRAVPTNEHYLPLLYTLAQQEEGEAVTFFTGQVTLGSVSMRSLRIG